MDWNEALQGYDRRLVILELHYEDWMELRTSLIGARDGAEQPLIGPAALASFVAEALGAELSAELEARLLAVRRNDGRRMVEAIVCSPRAQQVATGDEPTRFALRRIKSQPLPAGCHWEAPQATVNIGAAAPRPGEYGYETYQSGLELGRKVGQRLRDEFEKALFESVGIPASILARATEDILPSGEPVDHMLASAIEKDWGEMLTNDAVVRAAWMHYRYKPISKELKLKAVLAMLWDHSKWLRSELVRRAPEFAGRIEQEAYRAAELAGGTASASEFAGRELECSGADDLSITLDGAPPSVEAPAAAPDSGELAYSAGQAVAYRSEAADTQPPAAEPDDPPGETWRDRPPLL